MLYTLEGIDKPCIKGKCFEVDGERKNVMVDVSNAFSSPPPPDTDPLPFLTWVVEGKRNQLDLEITALNFVKSIRMLFAS